VIYKENFKNQLGYRTSKIFHGKTIDDHFVKDTLLINIRYVDLEIFRNKLMEQLAGACLRHIM
jgi:hypothetical protein